MNQTVSLSHKSLSRINLEFARKLPKDGFDEVVICSMGDRFKPFILPATSHTPSRLFISKEDWGDLGFTEMDVFPTVVRTAPFIERNFI